MMARRLEKRSVEMGMVEESLTRLVVGVKGKAAVKSACRVLSFKELTGGLGESVF